MWSSQRIMEDTGKVCPVKWNPKRTIFLPWKVSLNLKDMCHSIVRERINSLNLKVLRSKMTNDHNIYAVCHRIQNIRSTIEQTNKEDILILLLLFSYVYIHLKYQCFLIIANDKLMFNFVQVLWLCTATVVSNNVHVLNFCLRSYSKCKF